MTTLLGVADVTAISNLGTDIAAYAAAGLALAGVVLGMKLAISWVKSFGGKAGK